MRVWSALLVAASILIPCSSGEQVATVRNSETAVELEAQEHTPRLLSIGNGRDKRWVNTAKEELIEWVLIGGQSVPVRWRFNSSASSADVKRAAFVYDSDSPKLRSTWIWEARAAAGPIEHSIRIENLESREIWIPLQDSFRYTFNVRSGTSLEHLYVEKGAGKPSDVGTHLVTIPVGYEWEGKSSTYAHQVPDQPREVIPFFSVRDNSDPGVGWYVGVEFSGRTHLVLHRTVGALSGVIGLDPDPGPFRSRLKSHEVFETPMIFLGSFEGDSDALGNDLRPWIREVLGNLNTWRNPHYPVLVNNSWGSSMQVDEALALKMIRDSTELGLEMFHVDAGWFRGVGDWYPDPKKFPHGLAAIADNAHRHGLKFGLWVDWTQAGLDTQPGALNLHNAKVHDWTVSDVPANWKPEAFKGQTIDIGDSAAYHYARNEVFRIFESYRLDMLEHDGYLVAQGCVRTDHLHAPPDPQNISITQQDGSYIVRSSNSTDVSYHAVRSYYEIYKELRNKHPNALLEVCNDGGRMVDFGSAAHADYFSITDAYDPLSNRRAFYDASHVLPAAMLECYVEKWPTPNIESFRYMLRSGMQGWLTIMLNTNDWSDEQHAAAKQEFQLYKTKLRPLIRDANIYHIAPRPDGLHWDGTEFFDKRSGRGVVFAFRGSIDNQSQYSFKLRGMDSNKRYSLQFQDKSAPDRVITGAELMQAGLRVQLRLPDSSELVFVGEAK